jgi:hypothetical protein
MRTKPAKETKTPLIISNTVYNISGIQIPSQTWILISNPGESKKEGDKCKKV